MSPWAVIQNELLIQFVLITMLISDFISVIFYK